jgi:hypothetical protein
LNPGSRGGKPATNRLSYGAARQNAFRAIALIKHMGNFIFYLTQFSKPEEETIIKFVSSLEDSSTNYNINVCFLFNIVSLFRNLRWVL